MCARKNYEKRRHDLYHVAEERIGFCSSYSGFPLKVSGGICTNFNHYGIRIEKKIVQTLLFFLYLQGLIGKPYILPVATYLYDLEGRSEISYLK
jgi:hypothetical protein